MAREIRLPLGPDTRSFISTLSSDNYENLMLQTFMWPDLLYTFFFRYPRLPAYDLASTAASDVTITNNPPGSPSPPAPPSNGLTIDLCSQNPELAIVVTLVIWLFAANNFRNEKNRQMAARDNNSYQFIHQTLTNKSNTEKKRRWINHYFAQILREDKKLRKKYSSIQVDESGLVLRKKTRAKTPESSGFVGFITKKILGPVWDFLTISSFAYWLLWIGAAVFTSVFGVGIDSIGLGFAFGVPIALGLIYPVIKSKRYLQNTKQEAIDRAETEQDATEVLRRVMLRRKFDLEKNKLKRDLTPEEYDAVKASLAVELAKIGSSTFNNELSYLKQDIGKKTAVTFISDLVGSYIGAQYAAWIVTDLLAKFFQIAAVTPGVNMVMGWVLIAVSFVHATYTALTSYWNRSNIASKVDLETRNSDAVAEAATLEDALKAIQSKIDFAQAQLTNPADKILPVNPVEFNQPQLFSNVNANGDTNWGRFITFINAITTGTFFARLFLVSNTTAIFMPDPLKILILSVVSNPVAMGVLIGVGALYGLFKVYEYVNTKKEERAKEMLQRKTEHIDCLKKQLELAYVSEKVLSKRLDKQNGAEAAALAATLGNLAAAAPQPVVISIAANTASPTSSDSRGTTPSVTPISVFNNRSRSVTPPSDPRNAPAPVVETAPVAARG